MSQPKGENFGVRFFVSRKKAARPVLVPVCPQETQSRKHVPRVRKCKDRSMIDVKVQSFLMFTVAMASACLLRSISWVQVSHRVHTRKDFILRKN